MKAPPMSNYQNTMKIKLSVRTSVLLFVIASFSFPHLVSGGKCRGIFNISPSNKRATELCQEGHDYCRFFFNHNGMSCAEYCEKHGGECTKVESNASGYTCGKIELNNEKKCSDTDWNDNICTCLKPPDKRDIPNRVCQHIPDVIDDDNLKKNRYILLDDGTYKRGGSSKVDYTDTDTGGCSCYQILNGLGMGSSGQKLRGCRRSTMRKWIEHLRYIKRETRIVFPDSIPLDDTSQKVKGCVSVTHTSEGGKLELQPCNKHFMTQCWSFKYRKTGDRLYRIHPCADKTLCVEASGEENFDKLHLAKCSSKNQRQYFDWGPTNPKNGAVQIRPSSKSEYYYGICTWPDNVEGCFDDNGDNDCEEMPIIVRNCKTTGRRGGWPYDSVGDSEGWVFKKSKAMKYYGRDS